MWELITTFFASGASGGLLGGGLGVLKALVDNKRELALENLKLERDKLSTEEAKQERLHTLAVMSAQGKQETELLTVESEAAADLAQMAAIKEAQQFEFSGSAPSTFIENLRKSVRPVVAYWTTLIFTLFLGWVFWEFNDSVTPEQGGALLLSLAGTLTFLVTSQNAFYYVSRRPSN